MVGDIVRDKDGVSALAVFAELCEFVYSKGKKCSSYLTDLYEQ